MQNQGVRRVMLSLKTPQKNPSLPLPASGVAGIPWLVAASHQSLPLSSLGPLPRASVSPLLKGTGVIRFGAQPNAVQPYLNFINYICKDPISK